MYYYQFVGEIIQMTERPMQEGRSKRAIYEIKREIPVITRSKWCDECHLCYFPKCDNGCKYGTICDTDTFSFSIECKKVACSEDCATAIEKKFNINNANWSKVRRFYNMLSCICDCKKHSICEAERCEHGKIFSEYSCFCCAGDNWKGHISKDGVVCCEEENCLEYLSFMYGYMDDKFVVNMDFWDYQGRNSSHDIFCDEC